VSLYDAVKDLPLELESYDLDVSSLDVSSGFTRKTTTIRLTGGGEEGLGEDVTYEASEHDAQLERGAVLPLAGTWSIDSFSQHLAEQALFENPPERDVYVDYRRWGFESAALDLALRQTGQTLAQAVGRELRPLTYVVSMRLGEPPTLEPVHGWLDHYPTLRFKLDATSDWTDELVAQLRELGCVDSVDFKGHYTGTIVDQGADPELYRRVIDGLPGIWLEDPKIDDATRPVLEEVSSQVTWDAIIHSVADIEALPWPPKTVNVKPSRFGSIQQLFAAYDYCEERGIGAYGGGQFELGVGRGHIQYLAALFHPDTPNDVAPGGFNLPDPTPGLPSSPLTVTPRGTGFLAL
jgi:L-alanine-DL-glutamate epimerase-like enolase superfamily enzyme